MEAALRARAIDRLRLCFTKAERAARTQDGKSRSAVKQMGVVVGGVSQSECDQAVGG